MAEQRDDGQTGVEPGTGIQPAGPAHPAVPPPDSAPLDAEQLRQFQQFQQFQDYLKFTEAQGQGGLVPAPSQQPVPQQSWQPPVPVPPPGQLVPPERPPRKAPRWLTWLVRKLLGWLVAVLLLIIAGTWAYHHFFPSDDAQTSEQVAAQGGGTYKTRHILTTASPYESVRRVYDAIAQHGAGAASMVDHGCGLFDERTQLQFPADLGYPDCAAAIAGLHDQVGKGMKTAYAESVPSDLSEPLPGKTVTIRSCAFRIVGGPALGDFIVTQVEGNQWLITGHLPGPKSCSAPTR
ncbi:hypothetical protein [Amycolatopsis sp. H20-H5]|uniref:hypothetical protein n=1 Tax=Amycolatopsis sp. H20-H5 TaxID=3046309 RepID=UPI002DBC08B6|nr:hypothetical protein [Amycolatopsis sp. H20-H5]MEC3976492.1 hypothetical protein [Amycolatopsis sp. H20-H5]